MDVHNLSLFKVQLDKIVYDANVNMTQNTLLFYGSPFATVYYDWDAKDQLVGIRAPGYYSTEYTYDGQGRRIRIVEKDSAGTVTADRYFAWDGLRIAEERSSPGGPATKVFTSFDSGL